MKRLRPAFAMLALLLASGPLSAQQTVYQWKDARGVTHYTDTRPSGAHKTREISPRSATAPTVAAREQVPTQDDRCADARTNLERLKGEQPVGFDSDGDGKPDRNLSAPERAAQAELNQAAVKAWCGEG